MSSNRMPSGGRVPDGLVIRRTSIEPNHLASDSPPRRRRDHGYSLIEIVVAISLLGMVIVPVLAAVKSSIQVSSVASSAAKAETAMINAADRINRAPLSCDYKLYAQASVQTEGWPANAASVRQEWYNPQTNAWVDEGPTGDGCPYANVTEELVQRVTVDINVPNSDISRNIQVVKSNV